MNEILSIALGSIQADMARVDQIGANLANALTPGYKRGLVVQQAAAGERAFADHLTAAVGSHSTQAAAPPTVRHDARAGTLRATGHSLDLALAGPGYFEVITPDGPAYTRRGNFRLDAAGRLVTQQGHPVMGRSGEIVPGTPSPVITSAGAVLATSAPDETPVAQLKVVEFEDEQALRRIGDGLVAASAGPQPVDAARAQVRQGHLENSNVSSAAEMTQLIQALRHFESMHKVAQGYDDMLATAIRKLGETS